MRKIQKDEFDIRSILYYQSQGGIYNSIITILAKMRGESKYRGIQPTHKILNDACYHLAVCKEYSNVKDGVKYLSNLDSLTLCVLLAIAVSTDGGIVTKCIDDINDELSNGNIYYPKFQNIIQTYRDVEMEAFLSLHSSIPPISGAEELELKTIQLADANEEINKLKQTIQDLNSNRKSSVDDLLTFEGLMNYIEKQRNYSHSDQLLAYLTETVARYCTEEQWKRLCELKQKLLDNEVLSITNNNNIQNSNVFPGLVENPSFPVGVAPEEYIKQILDEYNNKKNDEQK